ncbi:MAG: PTS sugar transporter subunit IIA [Deltaproteobacteria bacterium]|nr:MAG: PTS sugar transporter subunit IIA [Deltaproteobacteria bacterium]
MKLSEMLDEENVIPELRATDKKGVLEELTETLASHEPSIDRSTLVKVLMERERLGSTGIGDGVAIPHGKLSAVSRPVISFGRSTQGLDFDAMDGQPTYLFFLIVAPENSSGFHLQILARIAKTLKNSEFRKKLMAAENRVEIYEIITRTDEEI